MRRGVINKMRKGVSGFFKRGIGKKGFSLPLNMTIETIIKIIVFILLITLAFILFRNGQGIIEAAKGFFGGF